MSKKVQKTLTGAMAAMMATGVVATPAMAATNSTDVDALYKAAYQATQKALTEKTQASVNEARAAIKALPANLDWAIGEFSKQVDTVQHPILVNIVNAIKTAEKTPTQANINAAKKAIPAELTAQWKNSYSSAVDKIQQGLQQKALEAVKKAETEKTQEAIDAAKELVADLATADSQAIKDWAKVLTERVEAVKLYDLNITSVENISKSSIKVNFEALSEALRNVTLEIIDNNGEVVEVEEKSLLIEGETYAQFNFTNVLKTNPEGTWTINGYEINLDEVAFVNNVKNETNSEKLYKLLKDSKKITDLDENNKEAYLGADRSKLTSYSDVQKLVDTVNEDQAKVNEVKYVIEVASEGTKTQFKNALATLSLERINSSWLDSYQEKVASISEQKASKVQEAIDGVNKAKLDDEIAKINRLEVSKKQDAISKTIDLVNEYMKPDAKDEKTKATMLENLNKEAAILRLQESDTLASLKAALKNLSEVTNDKTIFSYENDVNEDLMKAYYEADVRNATTAKDVADKLNTVEVAQVNKAIADIKAKATAAKEVLSKKDVTDSEKAKAKDNLLKAFNTLQTVSAKADVKFDASKVKAELWDLYADQFAISDASTVKAVQDLVESTNNDIVKTILSSATDETLLEKLKDSRLGLTTVIDDNKKAYVAELTTFQSVTTLDALKTQVDVVNSLATILDSSDVTAVKNELTKFSLNVKLTAYINLKDAQKSDVAELVIADIAKAKKDDKTINVDALVKAINDNIAKQGNLVGAVNDAKTTIATVTALEAVSPEFKALDSVSKVNVAEKFNNNRPTDKNGNVTSFTNFTEIRNLVSKVK